jgi:hypothetical protein
VALAGDLMTGVIDAAMQLELKANYIRAAYTNGQTLTATGTVIDSGRRTATAEARCWTNTASSPMQRLLSADSRNSESHPNFGSGWAGASVELEPESSPAPPGHGHLRDVGLAQHR